MRDPEQEPPREGPSYSWLDWRADGFRGRPPWRLGVQPLYLVLSLVLFGGLLAVLLVLASRLP
jgi:hypothetical protein